MKYMVALLTSEQLNVLVLLDQEKEAQTTKYVLVKAKLISEQNVVFVSEAFSADAPKEADIEDLLELGVYMRRWCERANASELKGKVLVLNANISSYRKTH